MAGGLMYLKGAVVAYERHHPGICLEGLRKTKKKLHQKSLAQIRTRHLLNTRLDHYRYTTLLGEKHVAQQISYFGV
jgi:hypothetical protein